MEMILCCAVDDDDDEDEDDETPSVEKAADKVYRKLSPKPDPDNYGLSS